MMEYKIFPLPVKPAQGWTFLTGESSKSSKVSYNKFVPFGTATIIPTPSDDSFVWTIYYRRPWVKKRDLDDKVAPEAKVLKFEVIVYVGVPKVNGDLFVYTGDWPPEDTRIIRKSLQSRYIRYQDLVERLTAEHESLYEIDHQEHGNSGLAFPSWNKYGQPPAVADAKMFYKELFEQGVNTYCTKEEQFMRYCRLASATVYPQKEPWSTLARFFNRDVKNITDKDTTLYFSVEENAISISDFQKYCEYIEGKAQERNVGKPPKDSKRSFVPAKCVVIPMSEATDVWKKDKERIGRHPIGLYETWVTEDQLQPLRTTGMIKQSYEYIKGIQNLQKGHNLKLQFTKNQEEKVVELDIGDYERETRTMVTRLKVNLTRNKDRDQDQTQVMGIGSNDAARIVWQHQVGPMTDAEWLHRSAFSFGGLGDESSTTSSSQAIENLFLGTEATNTAMIRVEEFIKRFAVREDTAVEVTTKPSGNAPAAWLAPTLEYKFSSKSPKLAPQTIEFHAQQRLTPLRFDFEVGRLVEAKVFGWEIKGVDADYEVPEEIEQKGK